MRDNGRGAGKIKVGNGLRGMRERLQELGGELVIDKGPEGGLRLSVCLPASAA
jgi:signal transduction histidine kinase